MLMSAQESEKQPEEKVLVYTGPSLDRETILEAIPEAIIRGPIKQSDLISDLLELDPTHILIIEGTFHHTLSVWQKEIMYAMQYPGVKAIYGAGSMGALRAADLADYGMIGCGHVFNWYYEGVLFDESEVSASYYQRPDGSYATSTITLVNIRVGLAKMLEAEMLSLEQAQHAFEYARSIHWTERTVLSLSDGFRTMGLGTLLIYLEKNDIKRLDALSLIWSFRNLQPGPIERPPQPSDLSPFFRAQFERDRCVRIGDVEIALQHLEAFITLHDVDYQQKIWDANNRMLALLLADIYRITITQQEFDTEWSRFCARYSLTTVEKHQQWLKDNNINVRAFCSLMLENGRLRKLHRALGVASFQRRNTQRLLDYLRSADAYSFWAQEAARHEKRIQQEGDAAAISIDLDASPHALMMEHLEKSGQAIDGKLEDYVKETGFASFSELMVALTRDKLGEPKDA
jgi:hypothetical protein